MDVVTIKSIEGVLGVVESDTLQVVLGPGKVEKIGAEFAELTGIPLGTAEEPTAEELAKENKAERKAMQNHPVQRFLRRIANIFLPFTGKVYNPAAGGLLAALIAGIFFAWLEKQIRKIMPDILQTFFAPLFTVIIGALVTLLVLQPIGAGLTTGIFGGLDFIYTKLGAIGGYILTACLGTGFEKNKEIIKKAHENNAKYAFTSLHIPV